MTYQEQISIEIVLTEFDQNGKPVEDDLTLDISRLLNKIDNIRSIERGESNAPAKGMMGPEIDLNTLLVQLVQVGTISTVVTVLIEWLKDRRNRRVEITIGKDTIVLERATPEHQERLVKQWIKAVEGHIQDGKKNRSTHR